MLLKYDNSTNVHIVDRGLAVLYGGFVPVDHADDIISLRSGDLLVRIYGKGLSLRAFSKPRCIVKGVIERIEFL